MARYIFILVLLQGLLYEISMQDSNSVPPGGIYPPPVIQILSLENFDGPCKNLNCTQLCVKVSYEVRCGCHDGYILNKDSRNCDISDAPADCEPVELKNGKIEMRYGLYPFHKTYFAQCDPGYILHGSFVATCDLYVSGIKEWTHPPPICVQKEKNVCGELPPLLNGKKECERNPVTVGKYCKFTCSEGYVRTGSEYRYCSENPEHSSLGGVPTQWSGIPTQCLPRQSRDPQSHNYYDSRRLNEQTASTDSDKNPRNSAGRTSRFTTAKPVVLSYENFDEPCKNLNCHQLCVRAKGLIRCSCNRGYILNKEDWRSCDRKTDQPLPKGNTCSYNNGGCDHICQLTKAGKVQCECKAGYSLGENRKWCLQNLDPPINPSEHPCSNNNGGCDHECVRTKNGGFYCKCHPGYTLAQDRKICFRPTSSVLQVTCGVSNGGCEQKCSVIENAIQCSCRPGYRLYVDGKHCVDIDECVEENGGCDQVCHNTRGSHYCSCRPGYKWDVSSRKCIDIDECQNERLRTCDHICINTEGSYSCRCHPGYVLFENHKCQGCRKGAYWSPEDNGCVDCPANSFTLSEGMTSVWDCVCRPGFTGRPEYNIPCEDVDECDVNNFGCSHQCVNVPGGAFCSCPVGFTTDNDNKTCIDIDECSLKNGGCEGFCHNTEGSFRCSCRPGFKTSNKDIYACEDIDECLEKNGGCQHHCNNYRGGYHCSCDKGFRLDSSMKNCIEISCPGFPTPHFSKMKCNKDKQKFESEMDRYPFGTVCTATCDTGFKASGSTYMECQEDGTWKGKLPDCRSQSCPPLKVPEHGDVHPPSCSTDGNTVKQTCTFTCHQGYRLKGVAVFSCKNNLTWKQSIADIPVCEPEEIRASIECIRDVTATLQPGKSSHNVMIPEPVTNMESYKITPEKIIVGKPMEFPAGKTRVVFSTSSPSSNRTAKCHTTVNVIDEEPPKFISCPNDILIENAKVDGEIVTWEEPMVIDNVGVQFLKSSVEPNSTLKPGSYHVEYIARDREGNANSCQFKINIVRLNCGNLTDPVHGKANCMDWLYGNLCQPECDEGYMRHPSDPSFYSCGDSGVWEPNSVISDCLPYTAAVVSTCPDGSELIIMDETEEEICLECSPHTPWSPTTRKCEEKTS